MTKSILDTVIRVSRAGSMTPNEVRRTYELAEYPAYAVAVLDQKQPEKHACFWCGGTDGALTVDDSRGHCSACGGPRSTRVVKRIAFSRESAHGTMIETLSNGARAVREMQQALDDAVLATCAFADVFVRVHGR